MPGAVLYTDDHEVTYDHVDNADADNGSGKGNAEYDCYEGLLFLCLLCVRR